MHEDPRRSRWIPWAFVGFFVVVILVNGTMIWFAFSSWTGLEAKSAYKQGRVYNQALERARTQDALGWTVDFDFEKTGVRRARLALELEDASANLIRGARVDARLQRPTHEGHDFETLLAWQPNGRYEAEIPFPLAGVWDVKLDVAAPGGAYRMTERVFLAP